MSYGNRAIQVERPGTGILQPAAIGSRADRSVDRVPADNQEDDGHNQHWSGNQTQGLEAQAKGRQSRSDLYPRGWLADEFQRAQAWRWPEQDTNYHLSAQQQARRIGPTTYWRWAKEYRRWPTGTAGARRLYSHGTIHDIPRTRHTIPTRRQTEKADARASTKTQRHAIIHAHASRSG